MKDNLLKGICIGQAKSGTASLCGMLSKNYRAAHESERGLILPIILKYKRDKVVREKEFRKILLDRQERLKLEFDIAWYYQFIIDDLLYCFPNTKFIVLIREPNSWLQSIVGHLIDREIPQEVIDFLDWWLKPDLYPHDKEDIKLKDLNVYSIMSLLNAWNSHINICVNQIPPSRRIIIKTTEINSAKNDLVNFLECEGKAIKGENEILNVGNWKGKLTDLVNPIYISKMIHENCENYQKYF